MVNATLKGKETHHLRYHLSPGCFVVTRLGRFVTASGRCYHPFTVYHTSYNIVTSLTKKNTANLSPGSHLTLSHGHQLICDHFRDNLRSRQRSQPGGKMDIQAVFGLVYARGGWKGWFDMFCWESMCVWFKFSLILIYGVCHVPCNPLQHTSTHIQLIRKQRPYTDITINNVNSSGGSW